MVCNPVRGPGRAFRGKTAELKGNGGVTEEVVLLHLSNYINSVNDVIDSISPLGGGKNSKDWFSMG